ncbi:hypothetical protein GWI33_006228 [Rhynchophorus ferrugineus]|uniref:Vacuolar protein-sorting-associated protein 36 n=1 Tax=Rhynchophorus ferrugineus TaxID=354439 RepID=A0A834IV36_RHYFE|nr:hypothetical protein GWI33_006228 [Rhynchophorus ferrugineus]
MNRFNYASPLLIDHEKTLACENNVRLYDGEVKTNFEGGELIITTHRILWARPGAIARGDTCLALMNELIVYIEEESPGAFSFKSMYNFIKLSFKDGYSNNVLGILNECLQVRHWEVQIPPQVPDKPQAPQIKLRTGIVGIERSLQEKQKAQDETLNAAFQDLNKLMSMAKDMVKMANVISTKIKEKQGDITEDETVKFKSYLLSLGIDDPVTRDAYKSNNQYYRSLANEISEFLYKHIEDMGGMMTLTDAYCRINRARGYELLSPEDILNACKLLESLGLPLKLFQFSSGVKVLQLNTLDSGTIAESTGILIEDNGSLSADELASKLGISITLARERLLTSEKYGKCCRDDSIEGLRFYPNLFLNNEE